MEIFTVKQQVTIWQEYEIEAESKEDAIAICEADYSLPNVEPIGNITRHDESEVVLRTELFDEDDKRIFVYDTEAE